MTQFDLDNMLNAIREEQKAFTEKKRAEFHEMEQRRAAAKELCKSIGAEMAVKIRELKDANKAFKERKEALLKAFPREQCTRLPHNQCLTKHDCYGMRIGMIKHLKEQYADSDTIDTEGINVHFNIEDDGNVSFTTILPKKK